MFEDELAADVANEDDNFYADGGGGCCQGSGGGGFNIINPASVAVDGMIVDPHSLMISELFPSQTPHNNFMVRGAGPTDENNQGPQRIDDNQNGSDNDDAAMVGISAS